MRGIPLGRRLKVAQDELNEAQVQAIEHLIAGKSKKATAEAVGVVPYTVSRWFQEAEFVAALNTRRLDVQQANVERLRSMAEKALGVLEDANPKVRLQAAMQILQAVKLTELPAPSDKTEAEMVRNAWQLGQQWRDILREMRADREEDRKWAQHMREYGLRPSR